MDIWKILGIAATIEEDCVRMNRAPSVEEIQEMVETAIMAYLHPESVDLTQLPPREEKLKNNDYGIADNETFQSGPNEDYTVRYDPRDATGQIGQEIMKVTVEKCVEIIERL